MKKLKLAAESLQVETFAAGAGEVARAGTVRGHSGITDTCYPSTQFGEETCDPALCRQAVITLNYC